MRESRKIAPIWILLTILVALPIVLMASCVGYSAFQARRPKDMPNGIWIDAPAVPFGFYHGWWLGCWVDADQQSNRCRLYGPSFHPPTVYEGRYLACEGKSPVPVKEMIIRPPRESMDMWLHPNGVAVVLQDGRLLVPAESYENCAKIRAGLQDRHELPAQAVQ